MANTKQMGVATDTYTALKKFRDENSLTSFTNAIQTLLNFYGQKDVEVDAFIQVKMGELKVETDKIKADAKLDWKLQLEPLVRELIEKIQREKELKVTQK